jgi:hypothetical protein
MKKTENKINEIIEQCLQGSEKFVANANRCLSDKDKPEMVRNILCSLNTEIAVIYSTFAKEMVKLKEIIKQEKQ